MFLNHKFYENANDIWANLTKSLWTYLLTKTNISFKPLALFVLCTSTCALFVQSEFSNSVYLTTLATQPLTCGSIWAIGYLFYSLYVLFVTSVTLYLFSNATIYSSSSYSLNTPNFVSISGDDLIRVLFWPILLLIISHSTWSGPALTAWFGHIVFSDFQFKFTYVTYFFFSTYLLVFLSSSHASSINFFDYLNTTVHFFTWLWLMTFSNNLFTFIFFLELLSALITLLLVSSAFSSYHFYNNLSFTKHAHFNLSTPTAFLQTLMFFFWVTLLSSLTLFVFLLTFYLKFFSFDFTLITIVFSYTLTLASLKSLTSVAFTWLLFISAISIKCGLLPFYLWKPSFFKGMTLVSLFFYVYVYYFVVFFMFVLVVYLYCHEVFIFFLTLTLLLVSLASLGLASILFESLYVKAFLALSSILNSTLILYGLCGFQTFDSILSF